MPAKAIRVIREHAARQPDKLNFDHDGKSSLRTGDGGLCWCTFITVTFLTVSSKDCDFVGFAACGVAAAAAMAAGGNAGMASSMASGVNVPSFLQGNPYFAAGAGLYGVGLVMI